MTPSLATLCRHLGAALIAAAAEIEQKPGAFSAGKDEGRAPGPRSRAGDVAPPSARPSSEASAEREALILAALAEGARSPAELMAALGVAKWQLRPLLLALLGSGRIVSRGQKRGTRYSLAGAGEAKPASEPEPVTVAKAPEPAPEPEPDPTPAPPPKPAVDTDALIARHLAEKGVTRCPTAYAAPVAGVEEKPGRLPHYQQAPQELHRTRAQKASARSRALNSGRIA